jgi:hypothetical protein
MTKTRINMGYEVRYENGSSHFLPNDIEESLVVFASVALVIKIMRLKYW